MKNKASARIATQIPTSFRLSNTIEESNDSSKSINEFTNKFSGDDSIYSRRVKSSILSQNVVDVDLDQTVPVLLLPKPVVAKG